MSLSLHVPRRPPDRPVAAILRAGAALVRAIDACSPRAGRMTRRLLRLAWWTLTLQLHIHVRLWLNARRARQAFAEPEQRAASIVPDPDGVVIAASDSPAVTVIIPTYGQVILTLQCLASIAAHPPEAPFEVLVIDDASPCADTPLLDRVRGIRLVRNPVNLGFLLTCNRAAELARGTYLYFLNNDTQVMEGWLDPMLRLLASRADVGAVGARLLSPDGRLQEAGGLIWRDASGWNIGRNDDPARPEYNYVRQVDYCSGAALMLSRATFLAAGGFDERFAPAYYEDTDLCFRLRQQGLKILYQPASRIVHLEGGTHGRDLGQGMKAGQLVNQRRFMDVWRDVLVRDHYADGECLPRARERAMHRRVVLVIDHYVPEPDRDAGSNAILACLRALIDLDCVVKFWPANLHHSAGYTQVLQQMGVEVLYAPYQTQFDTWLRTVGPQIDTVLISRPDSAEMFISAVRRFSRAAVIYYGHDLHFRRMEMAAQVLKDTAQRCAAVLMRAREEAIWQAADLSLYLSTEEAQLARSLQPRARVAAVVPYGFDSFATGRTPPPRQEILFVAGFGHPPNQDAALWFADAILPSILAHAPDARLSIIGSRPPPAVCRLAGPAIEVRADVSPAELEAAYARARIAVVPLRCGAGVKLKVVEALRMGLPLVTTPVGAQGLPGLAGITPVHDDPAAFADAALRLLRDDQAWRQVSAAQAAYAETHFSRRAVRESLQAVLLLAESQPQPRMAV